jgi:hypothetical protein
VQLFIGEGCFFGLCSVGDGLTYGFGNVTHPREHDPVAGRLERLRGRFAGFGSAVQDYLQSLETDEQIHCSPSSGWSRRAGTTAGWCSSGTPPIWPMLGQGGCLAIEDAWVLAEVLRAEATVEGVLAAYARRRRARVTWVHRQSRAVADSFRLPPPVRDLALRERGAAMLRQRFEPLLQDP